MRPRQILNKALSYNKADDEVLGNTFDRTIE
jgi:hypothetical protein